MLQFEEYIEGLKVVKVFCHETAAKMNFGAINDNLRHAATNAHTYASILMPIMGNISYISYAAVATLGSLIIMTVPESSIFSLSVGALFTFSPVGCADSPPLGKGAYVRDGSASRDRSVKPASVYDTWRADGLGK